MKTLDLHGIKHSDVQRALDVFFWEGMQNDVKTSVVVTGNSLRMKSIVADVVKEYGFKIITDGSNEGSLIIQM